MRNFPYLPLGSRLTTWGEATRRTCVVPLGPNVSHCLIPRDLMTPRVLPRTPSESRFFSSSIQQRNLSTDAMPVSSPDSLSLQTDMESYEDGFDSAVSALEGRVREFTGKAYLAKRQLTELKISRSKSLEAAQDGRRSSVDRGSATQDMSKEDAEEALDAAQKKEARLYLLSKGNISEQSKDPLPPREIYKECLNAGMSPHQSSALVIVHNPWFSSLINLIIVVASIAVGLETDNPGWSAWLEPINTTCLLIFAVELCAKLIGLGKFFWSDPDGANWNRFDFVIIGLSLLDWFVKLAGAGVRSGGFVMVLRVLRLLRGMRSLRTLKTSNSLMVLMESIGEALMPTTSVLIIILILFYIFAILFTELVGKAAHFEDDEYVHEHFGTVANSLGSLLQILTLDSWTVTCRYVQMNSESLGYILLVWALYVIFIVLAPLMMLNCLNAIFVEGVITKITHKKLEKVKSDLNAKHEIAARLKQLFRDLDKSGDGFITADELDDAIETTDVLPQIKKLGLKRHHLDAMFVMADDNGDGQIDCVEFLRGFSDLLNIPLNRKDIVKMATEQSSALVYRSRKDIDARIHVMDQKIDALMRKMGVPFPAPPLERRERDVQRH